MNDPFKEIHLILDELEAEIADLHHLSKISFSFCPISGT